MKAHHVYVISGASGVGKTTLSQLLLDSDHALKRSVSYTTRTPRPSEENDVAYHFVAKEVFQKMEATGEFIETTSIYGDRYGTAIHTIRTALETSDVLLVLDLAGCQSIKAVFPDSSVIYLVPSKMADLEARLHRRSSDHEDVIKRRLKEAASEIKRGLEIGDYIVVNDDLSKALFDVISIVRTTRIQAINRAELGKTLLAGD